MFLVWLIIYIGYNIYLLKQEPIKYVPPEFEDEYKSVEELTETEKNIEKYKIKLQTESNFNGLISIRIKANKEFTIDWGNGLTIPFTGSNVYQLIPPIGYPVGKYTIIITGQKDSILGFEYKSTFPTLDYIEIENIETISHFKIYAKIINSNSTESLLNTLKDLLQDPKRILSDTPIPTPTVHRQRSESRFQCNNPGSVIQSRDILQNGK